MVVAFSLSRPLILKRACPQLNAAVCWKASLEACNKPAVLSEPLLSSPKSFSVIVIKLNCCSSVISSSNTTIPKFRIFPSSTSTLISWFLYPELLI